MNSNDFSKWLQYNKEWKIEGGLNTFRTHCIPSRRLESVIPEYSTHTGAVTDNYTFTSNH